MKNGATLGVRLLKCGWRCYLSSLVGMLSITEGQPILFWGYLILSRVREGHPEPTQFSLAGLLTQRRPSLA